MCTKPVSEQFCYFLIRLLLHMHMCSKNLLAILSFHIKRLLITFKNKYYQHICR